MIRALQDSSERKTVRGAGPSGPLRNTVVSRRPSIVLPSESISNHKVTVLMRNFYQDFVGFQPHTMADPSGTPTRRELLSTTAVGLAGVVAGCSSSSGQPGTAPDCEISQSTGDVEPIEISADGRESGADVVLDVRWNARLQASIDGDAEPPGDAGNHWLVFVLEISNPTDSAVDVLPGMYHIEAETPDGAGNADEVVMAGHDLEQLESVSLEAGDQTAGTRFFEVPPEAASATLVPGLGVAFRPECDRSLSIPVPEE